MADEQIRLECYREAVAAERTRPGIRLTADEIAAQFAEFCGDNRLRLDALKMAISESNPRTSLEAVFSMALKFVEFAKPPQPEEVAVTQNPKKGRSRRS